MLSSNFCGLVVRAIFWITNGEKLRFVFVFSQISLSCLRLECFCRFPRIFSILWGFRHNFVKLGFIRETYEFFNKPVSYGCDKPAY